MFKSNRFLIGIPLLVMLAHAVGAVSFEDLNQCYTRSYTEAHLRSQPKQNVKTLALKIDVKGKFVTISGTNRAGQFGYLRFSCYENTGSITLAPSCATFEAESQLSIEVRRDDSIVIETRNTFLSDIGEDIGYVDDPEGHYMFYLDEANHSYTINGGPFFHYRLYPAAAGACPTVE